MRYAVTIATFGTAANKGTRTDRANLSLPRARALVERAARRGVRRFGEPVPSFAARFAELHESHLAHARHARTQGRTESAREHLRMARTLRHLRPDVEARELAWAGAPQRYGFLASQAWGARGGAFPVAYVSGVISLQRF